MLVITAPGQGAQTPGFLSPWLDVPGVAERLGTWSELAGADLIRCGTTAGADEIKDTAVAQPLLVAAALATAEALLGALPAAGSGLATAGHSVGELAAGAIAGVLTSEDALRLVAVRGRAMAAASAAQPTGMTAVLGGDEATVLAAIEAHGLTPANVNGAGQIVAAGTMEQLAAFAADPPAGARLRPLTVAGAFHTVHMAPAVADLSAAASAIAVGDPRIVAAVEPGRRHRLLRPRLAGPHRRAGRRAGPLGCLHAHDGRARGDRADRAAAGRDAHRPGPPRPARGGPAGPEDPRRS